MRPNFLPNTAIVAVAITGSCLLPSCSSAPPAQTTTVNVKMPDATKDSGNKTEIADAGTAGESGADEPAVKMDAEPTDRDVEDPVPAKKSASSKSSSSKSEKSDLMDFYDRLPSKHFTAFGGVNRRSLLKRKGAIVDYQHNFIEIPGSDDERDGDLRALQITLFPNGKEPWCAVSRIVWPQGNTPGALDFYYGEADDFDRHPRTAASEFFPYKLKRTNGNYESAWLPQRGLDITINSAQDAESNGPVFRYNSKAGVGEAAFKRIG